MSQQKSKKTLINWDLVSVNPNNKTWDWKDLFYFWGVNIQSIIGFSLIASLYIIYDMNSMVVFFWYSIRFFFGLFIFKLDWKTITKIWITVCCFIEIFIRF